MKKFIPPILSGSIMLGTLGAVASLLYPPALPMVLQASGALLTAGGISLAARGHQATSPKGIFRRIMEIEGVETEGHYPKVHQVHQVRPRVWVLTIRLPVGLHRGNIEACIASLEYAYNGEVEIWQEEKDIKIRLSCNPLPREAPWSLPSTWSTFLEANTLPLVLGVSRAGQEVINLAEVPHLLIGGQTYGGKSNLIHVLFQCLINNPRVLLYISDLSRVEFSYMENHAYYADTFEKTARVVNYLHGEMFHRLEVLRSHRVVKVQDLPPDTLPYIVFVCDEFSLLGPEAASTPKEKKAREEVQVQITEIANLARKIGIHLIFSTQSPRAEVIRGLLKQAFPGTVAFKVRNSLNSVILLDTGEAADLPGIKGRAIYQLETNRQLQTYFLPVDQARALLPPEPVTYPGPPPAPKTLKTSATF